MHIAAEQHEWEAQVHSVQDCPLQFAIAASPQSGTHGCKPIGSGMPNATGQQECEEQVRSVQALSSSNRYDCKPAWSGRHGCKPTGSGMHNGVEQ